MSDSTLTLLTLALLVGMFVWNRLPVEFVAIGSALVLYALGVLTLPEALAGFGDPAVILIAALFVVSEGLDSTGVTTWVGQSLVSRSGSGTRRLLLLTMLLSAGLTALIGLNGAVAALLPMAVIMSLRRAFPASRLLMPLAFAGSAGGLLLLTGSPVNIVISEAAGDAGVGEFGFVEFALVGIPLLAGTIGIVLLLGDRLLPDRVSDEAPPDLSGLAQALVREYSLDNVFHLRVQPGSALIGAPRVGWDLSAYPDVRVITVLDGTTQEPVSEGAIAAGDRLTLIGDPDVVVRLAGDHALDVEAVRTAEDVEQSLMSRSSGAAEVVIPPRSTHVGVEVQPSQLLNGSLIVLAVTRQGHDLGAGPVRLKAGDTLLVEGPWSALETAARGHDVLVVDSPDLVRRQSVPLGKRSRAAIAALAGMVVLLATGVVPAVVAALLAAGAMILLRVVSVQQAYRGISWTTVLLVVDSPDLVRRQSVPLGKRSRPAIAALAGMVVLLATGVVPAVVAALLAAGAMILLRVVSVQQAYRGISWTTVLLVAGMIPMATAVGKSGAGELVATVIVDSVGDSGPLVLLAALFVITVVFGQLISNTATALVMIPIAVSAAAQLDVSARPVLMSLCVAAAVAFLTPVATPANMMVMGPAGYRFGDYWKLGLPLVLLFGLVSVLLVPVFWPF